MCGQAKGSLAATIAVLAAAIPVLELNKPGTPADDAAVEQIGNTLIDYYGDARVAMLSSMAWQMEHGDSEESFLAFAKAKLADFQDEQAAGNSAVQADRFGFPAPRAEFDPQL